jgi:hypothetical protein
LILPLTGNTIAADYTCSDGENIENNGPAPFADAEHVQEGDVVEELPEGLGGHQPSRNVHHHRRARVDREIRRHLADGVEHQRVFRRACLQDGRF